MFPTDKLATLDGGGEDSAVYILLYKAKGCEGGFRDWHAAYSISSDFTQHVSASAQLLFDGSRFRASL